MNVNSLPPFNLNLAIQSPAVQSIEQKAVRELVKSNSVSLPDQSKEPVDTRIIRASDTSLVNEPSFRRNRQLSGNFQSAGQRAAQNYEDNQQLLKREEITGLIGIDFFV